MASPVGVAREPNLVKLESSNKESFQTEGRTRPEDGVEAGPEMETGREASSSAWSWCVLENVAVAKPSLHVASPMGPEEALTFLKLDGSHVRGQRFSRGVPQTSRLASGPRVPPAALWLRPWLLVPASSQTRLLSFT